jgi:hypothetical protein
MSEIGNFESEGESESEGDNGGVKCQCGQIVSVEGVVSGESQCDGRGEDESSLCALCETRVCSRHEGDCGQFCGCDKCPGCRERCCQYCLGKVQLGMYGATEKYCWSCCDQEDVEDVVEWARNRRNELHGEQLTKHAGRQSPEMKDVDSDAVVTTNEQSLIQSDSSATSCDLFK